MFDNLKKLGDLKRMRDQAMQVQQALASERVEIEEQGIKVVITGDQRIEEIEIDGQTDSRLIAVLNKAVKRSQEVAAKKLQEMSGVLGGLLGG